MLLKIEIVLYRCFRRVLISILCLVMHVSCAYVLRQLSVFWDKVGLFVVKTVWQPCEVHRALLGIVNNSI